MKVKVRKVVDDIVDILKVWKGVRAVVLQHFVEKDIFDPNFSITLDVFRSDGIPGIDEREKLFTGARYFESSRMRSKDRFMQDDLPVRISYKDTARVDAVLAKTDQEGWLSMERGTYLFHRIATGTVVWSGDDWINGVLEKLDRLPDSFWSTWIESCHRRLDHFLGDLGAAALKDDPLYFRLSLSGFLRLAAELLFALNHVFEPGPRDYTASLALLEILPDGFAANWDSLLRDDAELPPDRKREIAELLVRGLFALSP
jgi:hypothetical protein